MADWTQIHLKHGEYTAAITDYGATLRRLAHGGRDLVAGFDAGEQRLHYRGAVLAPWPNRIAGGRYRFEGKLHQLEISEPERGNALHGLVSDIRWSVGRHTVDEVELHQDVDSPTGYPFRLRLTATYSLSDAGLRWTVSVVNTGDGPAPYGVGPHPYLLAGDGSADDWELVLPAADVMELGAALVPVGGDIPDFRPGHSLRAVTLDHTFTGLGADSSGLAHARLHGRDGGVEIAWDPGECPWVQVYTYDLDGPTDDLPARSAVAIEPMTCPPFAFNSGTDVITLQPGDTHTASWLISALP